MKEVEVDRLKHETCVFDFCGNNWEPGICCDTYTDPEGRSYVVFGLDWVSYTPTFIAIKEAQGNKYIEEVISGKSSGVDWLGEELEKAWNTFSYPDVFPVDAAMEGIIRDLSDDRIGTAIAFIDSQLVRESNTKPDERDY